MSGGRSLSVVGGNTKVVWSGVQTFGTPVDYMTASQLGTRVKFDPDSTCTNPSADPLGSIRKYSRQSSPILSF